MVKTPYGYKVNPDEKLVTSVVGSLVRNNTFCPNIKRVIFNLGKGDNDQPILATTVFFADNTKVSVKNSREDEVKVVTEKITLSDGSEKEVETASLESREIGLAYAILKRIVCTPDKNGTIESKGFITFLHKQIKNAWNQPVEAARAKGENAIKAKNAPVATEKSVKAEKPSLRKCVTALSELLTKLDDKLSK